MGLAGNVVGSYFHQMVYGQSYWSLNGAKGALNGRISAPNQPGTISRRHMALSAWNDCAPEGDNYLQKEAI